MKPMTRFEQLELFDKAEEEIKPRKRQAKKSRRERPALFFKIHTEEKHNGHTQCNTYR